MKKARPILPVDEWRPMRRADLAAVVRISDAVHGALTEGRAIYEERLALYPAGCGVLERGGIAAGYLVSHPWHRHAPPPLNQLLGGIPADADTFYLHDIALLPSQRGTGAGRAALELVARQALAAGFADITLIAVNGADRYWAARGFAYAEAETSPSYGQGAFLMHRPVTGLTAPG